MTTLKLMTTAACLLALTGTAYAADKPSPQIVPGTAVEGNMKNNAGALTSPEANKSDMTPSTGNSQSGDAAANIPGTKADGNKSEDKATLSGDNSAPSVKGSGEAGNAAANIPGTKAGGNKSADNPSLGGSSKDKM
jgi:hypothetical protein